MAAPKRTLAERERDLVEIQRLYVAGATERQIAAQIAKERPYTLSQAAIHHDIGTILDRWRKTACEGIEAHKARELARLAEAERNAWHQFQRSQRDRVRRVKETTSGVDGTNTKKSTMREEQCGDPRYLDIVLRCIEKRCKILGVDAPTKIAPTDPSGENPYNAMRDGQLVELAAMVTAIHAERKAENV